MVKRLIILALLAVVAAGAAFWWFVLRDDAPPRAQLRDRSSDTTVAATASTGTAGPAVAGAWSVQPDEEVFVGYRVTELYAGETIKNTAVGRTPAVTGTITITGTTVDAASFIADLTQLVSDESRRDNRMRDRGLETNTFPNATFTLTTRIQLGDPALDTALTFTATGDLTLHGVTRSIEVAIDARWNGDTIDLAGGVPIVLADYEIEPPDVAGFVAVDGNGEMEFQLSLTRA
ncbi:MAG: YceI family protein [Actinomycetota bacterium]